MCFLQAAVRWTVPEMSPAALRSIFHSYVGKSWAEWDRILQTCPHVFSLVTGVISYICPFIMAVWKHGMSGKVVGQWDSAFAAAALKAVPWMRNLVFVTAIIVKSACSLITLRCHDYVLRLHPLLLMLAWNDGTLPASIYSSMKIEWVVFNVP